MPSLAQCRATARPMPEEAPVMAATLPAARHLPAWLEDMPSRGQKQPLWLGGGRTAGREANKLIQNS